MTFTWNVSIRKLLPAVSWNNMMFLSILKTISGQEIMTTAYRIFSTSIENNIKHMIYL